MPELCAHVGDRLPGLNQQRREAVTHRGHIQSWWGAGNPIPDRSAQRILKAADQILRAAPLAATPRRRRDQQICGTRTPTSTRTGPEVPVNSAPRTPLICDCGPLRRWPCTFRSSARPQSGTRRADERQVVQVVGAPSWSAWSSWSAMSMRSICSIRCWTRAVQPNDLCTPECQHENDERSGDDGQKNNFPAHRRVPDAAKDLRVVKERRDVTGWNDWMCSENR